MALPHEKHPFWPLVQTVVTTGCVAVLLLVTASSFDATEIQTITGTGLVNLAANYFLRPHGGA